MRFTICLGLILSLFASARAQGSAVPDTLGAEFLFRSGDTVYVRCAHVPRRGDSVSAPGFESILETRTPVWLLKAGPLTRAFQPGDSLHLLCFDFSHRAASLALECAPDIWDPLTIESGSAYGVAELVHRSLLQLDSLGDAAPDLAKSWYWKGSDLIVVIDTASRLGDGSKVDAYRCKSSLERFFWYRRDVPAYSWQLGIAGLEHYRNGNARDIVGLIPRSPDTLQINLTRPNYELPRYLASVGLSIVRWHVAESGAPITATAGHYGLRDDSTLMGQSPALGRLLMQPARDPSVAVLAPSAQDSIHRDEVLPGVVFPIPELVVIRRAPHTDPLLLAFLSDAVDYDAAAEVSAGGHATGWHGEFARRHEDVRPISQRVDFSRARDLLKLLKQHQPFRIGYDGDRSAELAAYVVNSLQAWGVACHAVDERSGYDLRVETWRLVANLEDAYVETALRRLGRTESDSLVQQLLTARATADTAARRHFYRSLMARLADLDAFLVVYQGAGQFATDPDVHPSFDADPFGRPRGAVYEGGENR